MKIFVETDLLLWESSCTYQTLGDALQHVCMVFMLVGLVPLEMRCEVVTLHRFFGGVSGKTWPEI